MSVPRLLAIHFPVWRELKRNLSAFPASWAQWLAIHFPVWRELKHRLRWVWHSDTFSTCYTLSRLKGIETLKRLSGRLLLPLAIHFPVWRELKLCNNGLPFWSFYCLLYTFPFEGNWNSVNPPFSDDSSVYLLYTFPFEGNWNNQRLNDSLIIMRACYTLSRLKGIETIGRPVWNKPERLTCYTLSRLKGIETLSPVTQPSTVTGILLYTFPFEGNWNSSLIFS